MSCVGAFRCLGDVHVIRAEEGRLRNLQQQSQMETEE
jgi:hypothetical protein